MNETSSKNYIWISIGILILVGILIAIGITRTHIPESNDLPLIIDPTLQTTETSEQPLSENNTNEKAKIMQTATFTTSMGDIVIQLDNTNTPNTVANFTKLAGEGFYNGTKFHRVIAGFMIQGGDPLSKKPYEAVTNKWGTGGPGYEFADEIKPTNSNIRGTISMANAGPNTNGSQFFINVADNTYLNPKHTVFGTVTKGMDVVDAIANTKTKDGDQPVVDVVVQKITIE